MLMRLNRKRQPLFYGWWIVSACFLIMLLTGGFVVLGFTAFFEPITRELGWSYTQVSLAASFRGAEVGLLAPLMGLFIDRWGPRRLMIVGIIITGSALVFLSRITSLSMFYVGFALIALGMSGSSPTVMMTTVVNWFRKKVGIVSGIIGSGFALGGLLVPLVVKLIDVSGWRTAIFILGITILVIGLPLSLLLRHRPEQYGYLPDGESSLPGQVIVPSAINEMDIATKQALKSRTFWHIGLAMVAQFAALSTVIAHVMPALGSVGIPRSTASLVAMAVPLVTIVGRLGSGWLSDRFTKKRVATGFFTIMVLGLFCMLFVSDEAMWVLIPFIIFFGIGWGGNNTVRVAMLSEYFGRSNFGSIFGFMMGITALGSVAGPLFAGWIFDTLSSYQMAWLALTILAFIATLVIAATPPVTPGVRTADK